jgi:hypothetical protein
LLLLREVSLFYFFYFFYDFAKIDDKQHHQDRDDEDGQLLVEPEQDIVQGLALPLFPVLPQNPMEVFELLDFFFF